MYEASYVHLEKGFYSRGGDRRTGVRVYKQLERIESSVNQPCLCTESFALSLSNTAIFERQVLTDLHGSPRAHTLPRAAFFTHRICCQHVDPGLSAFRQQQGHERKVAADACRGQPHPPVGDIFGRGRQTRGSNQSGFMV